MTRNVLAFAAVLAAAVWCFAETYTGEASNRLDINMGITPWKFTTGDPVGASTTGFADGGWKTVGIPHCVNQDDSYTNCESGGTNQFSGTMWYRKHFSLDQTLSARKVFIEFQGAHVGAAVYINGTFIPGNSALNPACTHVIGFIPFIVDITQYVQFGGADNILAVKVSNGGGMYANPGFGTEFRFGQHDGGLVRPVWMHVTDKVYVPANIYSVVNKWGTCVGAVTASDAAATVRIMTNVQNEDAAAQTVTVTTKVVDAANTVVLSMDKTQAIGAGANYVFDQSGDVASPHLWYPAASPWGKPYMYKVYHIVKVGGATVDVFTSPLGIRVITWDKNFPIVNGHPHYLWGMSGRYDYPALGSGLPDNILWQDVKLTADIGGRVWRPGHSTCAHEFVEAGDAFGVMIDQPSGDGEGAWQANNYTANMGILKTELHRDMIIRDRNNPSIIMWEVTNAGIMDSLARALKALAQQWDPISYHAQSDRSYLDGCKAGISDVIECSSSGCETGEKLNAACTNFPAFGAEAWDAGPARASRFAWDYELAFAGAYLQNWKNSAEANAFGLAHWYLAEAPGEVGAFLGDARTARSFGSSVMDASRFPKLLYHIYQVAWIPFSMKPGVFLAHHWNRSGTVQVNAFSNCPKVQLLLNGTNLGIKVPNPWNLASNDMDIQNTTNLPLQCWWNVAWQAGTLRAEGLDSTGKVVCFDEKKTAGAPDHILLTVDSQVVKPDGSVFNVTANGTDVFTVTAKEVDAAGVLCPTASDIITFAVSGPCEYRGGTDAFVTAGQGLGYHAPLDPNLSAEGGMCRVAVRATFTPGTVTVTASSGTLGTGSASQVVLPVSAGPTSANRPVPQLDRVGTAPTIKIVTSGSVLRYFVGRPANASVEVLDASGKVLRRIAAPRLDAGWHSLPMRDAGSSMGSGFYLVRIIVDGTYKFVKPIVMMR
jgi:beta-galactosidase